MRFLPVFLLCGVLLLTSNFGVAQDRVCGTEEAYQEALEHHPHIAHVRAQLEQEAQNYAGGAEDTSGIYCIPIVFHVIHQYGSERVTKEQINDAVRIINEDFRKLSADTGDVIDSFKSIAADAQIEFRLARLDPDGNCTDGVTYHESFATLNAGENVKSIISWDTEKYLNVWVVGNIASGAGAYAYYPGTAPSPDQEGIVCRASQLGGVGASNGSNFARRTLTHEIGHYLNLPHVWGSNNNVAEPTACGLDDGIGDTPNCIGTPQSCDLGRSTCGSLDNVQNFMDYSNCANMFTTGQKNRMHAALNTFVAGRNNLWTAANLIATGTNDGFVNTCAPVADFVSNTDNTCQGEVVEFTDLSYNEDVDGTWTWTWSTPGATPAVSNVQNPIVTYTSPGTFPVSLTVTNSMGQSTVTKTSVVTIHPSSGGFVAPYYEGIENNTFPAHPGDSLKDWRIETLATGPTWHRTQAAAFTGQASFRVNGPGTGYNSIHELISPPIDLTSLTEPEVTLSFWMAYAQQSANSEDQLRMWVSDNCGQSWALKYATGGASMSTAPTHNGIEFIPTPSEWERVSPYIGNYAGSNILLKFEFTNNSGNYFYLDNINLAGADSTDTLFIGQSELDRPIHDVSVYPTPFGDDATVMVDGSAGPISYVLFDLTGRELGRYSTTRNAGVTRVPISHIARIRQNGVYLLRVEQNGVSRSLRVIRQQF